MLPDWKTVIVALWAPALAGTVAAAVTWLVWYFTAAPCASEHISQMACEPGAPANYISPGVLHHCVIHASIAITIIGGSDLMLFLRERHRNNQMMDIMKSALEEAAEGRRVAEERAAEERRWAEERAAEERRNAAAERQAFLDALNKLTEAIVQNGQAQR